MITLKRLLNGVMFDYYIDCILTKNSNETLLSGCKYSKVTVPSCFRLMEYIKVDEHSSAFDATNSPRAPHCDLEKKKNKNKLQNQAQTNGEQPIKGDRNP